MERFFCKKNAFFTKHRRRGPFVKKMQQRAALPAFFKYFFFILFIFLWLLCETVKHGSHKKINKIKKKYLKNATGHLAFLCYAPEGLGSIFFIFFFYFIFYFILFYFIFFLTAGLIIPSWVRSNHQEEGFLKSIKNGCSLSLP
jgi:hypothetical protein